MDAGAGDIISLSDVRLTLQSRAGTVNILRGVDLRAAPGERLAIMGPSGAGKTTLLMLLAGLERASSGTVRVAGHDLSALDEDGLAAFRRENVGIVFQAFHLAPAMTALENAALSLEFSGRRDAFARAGEALAAVGLKDRLGHYPAELSGGEQQRVALARALAPRPRLLLADEPTGNLDGATGEMVMDLLFSLSEAATLVLVTHDPGLAGRCGRMVRVRDGRVEDGGAADG
ncbi:ABC transporter ATP-binding protein [Solidesulfovibrio sp.]|uniref:ABC transporter ATP-binding protein n=1 Tax=Solidesulfovibrio sp. TaxID=2910990 RepID=UPI00262BAC11|nr:ABC transporter ATP-binding protein [Solidesulfovibrio sp.]